METHFKKLLTCSSFADVASRDGSTFTLIPTVTMATTSTELTSTPNGSIIMWSPSIEMANTTTELTSTPNVSTGLTTTPNPCNNYTPLDQPWRATNTTGLNICDRYFNWNGWYRLLYYGMSVRMADSCVNQYRCGTDIALWLNGSHPQIEDGIVTRGVCGRSGNDCCYYNSTPIRVKACPGNYYVYEFVKPNVCDAAYCADTTNNITSDPCSVYSDLNNDWRKTESRFYSSYSGFDDTLVEWSGWYRLYLQGKSAQIPESDWCWSSMSCGGYTALLLGGSHPRPQDGIVTRDIYGTYVYSNDSRQCNSYRSNPIQVKACPGNYYVYRLVKPAVSIPMPTYCAATFNDPCNNYTALDQPWRATNASGLKICDRFFNWTGWYRLLYYGMSVRMPDSCVNQYRCGTYYTLWLIGSHPQIDDGIVTRGVCGRSGSDCCYYSSTPIRVKACPGNYYVYEFVKPNVCDAAYCADVNTVTTNTGQTSAPSVAASQINTNTTNNITSDPCSVYSDLNNDWRKTESRFYSSYSGFDDTLVEWSGWYRLYLQGKSAQIPESDWCWSSMSCGGYTALLLGGSHPRPQDGIVTRDIYGTYVYSNDSGQCNSYRSNSIQVKACPGNYYVYRLVKPALSIPMPTYCAVAFNTPSYDPCNNYTSLDQTWRAINETGGSYCDRNFTWTGWYRLLYNGMSVRMPESCVNQSRCGTDVALWLNGSHPQIKDGIVSRGVCGRSGSDCCYYRSTPIQVKACPENYYVYEFVRPFICNAAYCAVNFKDPCNNYTALDQPWRATNATGLWICDRNFNWNGWYRLLYYGMNIRMPESCVALSRCGTDITLWLNGSHPQIDDGIVTRGVCGGSGSDCCYYRSTPIRIKACPGNYYVYEFVKPNVCYAAYCADVNTVTPNTAQMNATSVAASQINTDTANNMTSDPCSLYTVLDNEWRRTNSVFYTSYGGFDDTLVEWSGWYRLNLQGKSAQIPESDWCWSYITCGGYTALLLGGSHPVPQDGIVTRDIYGSSVDSRQCNSYRSNPIQVKACPGNYYVYRLIKPALSLPMPTYCAAAFIDPCNNYTVLDQPWRATNETGGSTCDRNVIWNGWYRLLYNGMNVRMADSCVNRSRCGTDITLWLNGSHPKIEDGIVTRGVCGRSGSDCCFYNSTPIQVKACPGNYYIYKFVGPTFCTAAYCTDVNTITPNTTLTSTTSVPPSNTNTTAFIDPCNNYTVLDQPWRATNETGLWNCDRNFNWNGWYRLLYNGMNIRMADSCVNQSRCGTDITLWLNGSHPRIEDGIVTRGVCGRSGSDCCFYNSTPIQVKACPGNYYIYKFVGPTFCTAAYCTDVNTITPNTTLTSTTSVPPSNTNTNYLIILYVAIGIALCGIAAFLAVYFWRRRRRNEVNDENMDEEIYNDAISPPVYETLPT
ncbi:uncharacterized protein LOC118801327 [Colossoma macropomum]|uniref:uncharacterized protein LOC118801327 n=1 Tax=Colossoma macropomum TaxID=42526 RepID=UPI00186406B2|nr:uncharacterized protein LOC118801327 [Colossoma macropomum]